MRWIVSEAAKKKGKKKTKDKAKLRKYWRMVYPDDYVKDMIGSVNGK